MKTTRVYRPHWLRGEGSSVSYLLRPYDRKMCCMGFRSIQHEKLTMQDIHSQLAPYSLKGDVELTSWTIGDRSDDWIAKIMQANDNAFMSDAERECLLSIYFAAVGEEIEFYG